jgi:hypothetical protein
MQAAALKAAELAALQAKIQQQIASTSAMLQQAKAGGGTAASGTAPKAAEKKKARDFSLRLDEYGRQVDADGNVVEMVPKVSTLKVNQERQESKEPPPEIAAAAKNPYLAHVVEAATAEADTKSAGQKVAGVRPKRDFNFVEEGTYVKEAEKMRNREQRQLLRLVERKPKMVFIRFPESECKLQAPYMTLKLSLAYYSRHLT